MARWSLPGLGAAVPDPDLKEQLALFGQFVGDWDIDRWGIEPDGSERRYPGRVYFRWILHGHAVQDIWSMFDEDPARERPIGTTIRFPNPGEETWTSVWIAPDRGLLRVFAARKVGEEVVLATRKDDGNPEHWIFSEITADAFRWRAEDSVDGGKTWKLTEEMRIRRSPGAAEP